MDADVDATLDAGTGEGAAVGCTELDADADFFIAAILAAISALFCAMRASAESYIHGLYLDLDVGSYGRGTYR